MSRGEDGVWWNHRCDLQCTLYTVPCPLHTVNYDMYNAKCTLYSLQCIEHTELHTTWLQCKVYTPLYTLHTTLFTLSTTHYTLQPCHSCSSHDLQCQLYRWSYLVVQRWVNQCGACSWLTNYGYIFVALELLARSFSSSRNNTYCYIVPVKVFVDFELMDSFLSLE